MAKVIKLKNDTYLYGTIIEEGSNSNGHYVKYSNGILYQHNNMQVYDQAINNSYGSIYQGTREITFPIDFKNTDYIGICGRFQWGTGASWGTVYESSSKSSMRIRGFDYFSRASGTKVNIDWFAIGKWK